jgi:hypothetical protein
MAFDSRALSVLAYANGFTLWHYRTADGAGALTAEAGYFAAADELLRAGDRILVSLAGGNRPAQIDLLVTAAAPAAGVQVAAL